MCSALEVLVLNVATVAGARCMNLWQQVAVSPVPVSADIVGVGARSLYPAAEVGARHMYLAAGVVKGVDSI